jgi:hypothetical protein
MVKLNVINKWGQSSKAEAGPGLGPRAVAGTDSAPAHGVESGKSPHRTARTSRTAARRSADWSRP